MVRFLWGKMDGALAVGVVDDGELISVLKYGGKCAVWSVQCLILKNH